MNNDRAVPPSTQPAWRGKRPRVAILGEAHRRITPELTQRVREIIERHADLALLDLDGGDAGQEQLDVATTDCVLVLGGDGSILRTVRRMHRHQLPVLGINLGKLGFLTGVQVNELERILPQVAAGDCRVVSHLMFDCQVHRGDELLAQTLGLNETAILGGLPFRIVDIDFFVDQQLATRYRCDGLLISTPVGSTAHNLSAGGPILRKDLDAFVVSAVSPHTLTIRPVVDSAERIFELAVPAADANASVVVDGQPLHRLQPSDRVKVQRAEPRFQLIEVAGHGYYRTLREKLGWAGQMSGLQDGNDA